MLESEAEAEELFRETRDQLLIVLRQMTSTGVVARSLVEDPARTERVFGVPLPALLEGIYGSSDRGYQIAIESILESGHFADAEEVLARPGVSIPTAPGARSFARGMSRYLSGDFEAAVEELGALVRGAGYGGVGTCEYLVAPEGAFYFLEVNPRLQVEHGVTELLTDVDLVKWQIRIARGEHLPETAPEERGCAIEVRLCAEDPANGFAPAPGEITMLELPSGPGVRVDAGVGVGDRIPAEFDSMIAKILARGQTRDEALARLRRALTDVRAVVAGGMTNKGFLLDVLGDPEFRRGGVETSWLDRSALAAGPAPTIDAALAAALQIYQRERAEVRFNFYAEASRGRPQNILPSNGREIDVVFAGVPYRFTIFATETET